MDEDWILFRKKNFTQGQFYRKDLAMCGQSVPDANYSHNLFHMCMFSSAKCDALPPLLIPPPVQKVVEQGYMFFLRVVILRGWGGANINKHQPQNQFFINQFYLIFVNLDFVNYFAPTLVPDSVCARANQFFLGFIVSVATITKIKFKKNSQA